MRQNNAISDPVSRYVRRSGFDRRRRPAENLPAAAAFRRDADDFFRRRRDFGVSRF